jgi:hypothetical protein
MDHHCTLRHRTDIHESEITVHLSSLRYDMTDSSLLKNRNGNYHATKILRTLLHKVTSSSSGSLSLYRDIHGVRITLYGRQNNERIFP